jgi:cysteine-rich repeat protein
MKWIFILSVLTFISFGCSFDPSGLPPVGFCGNSVIDPGEVCDAVDLGNQSCLSMGYDSGTLTCRAECTFNTSECVGDNPCGNGEIDGIEACDGENLNSETCLTRGFDSGTLICSSDCFSLVESGCTTGNSCGNGSVDSGELCDGAELDGATCISMGFNGGSLGCSTDCLSYDSSGCSTTLCGNNILDNGEVCDDGHVDECGSCNSDCTAIGTGSMCGDGELCPEFEVCDDGYMDACGSCNEVCSAMGTGSCGDGQWCPETEGCDDGNGGNSDGCSSVCIIEESWNCINSTETQSICSSGDSSCPGSSINPGIITDSSDSAFSEIDDYEGWPALGNEVIYSIAVPPGSFLRARLFNYSFDGVLIFMNDCPASTGSLLRASDSFYAGGEESTIWVNHGTLSQIVYISVDGYGVADSGSFDLEVILETANTPTGGSVIAFNEYFAYPLATESVLDEWVEFYHGGTNHLNLNGCRFVTDTLDETIARDLIVSPGQYFVFNNVNSSSLTFGDGVVWRFTATQGIIHGVDDTLYLVNPSGTVIDSIGVLGTNNFPSSQGQSTSLNYSNRGDKNSNDIGTNWYTDSSPTPGSANN